MTAYVSASQIPQMIPSRQSHYAINNLGQPIMSPGYIQDIAGATGQHYGHPIGQPIPGSIILPTPVLSSQAGYPPGYMGTQPQMIHLPHVGDIHTSYLDGDNPRFHHQSRYRMRSPSFTSPQGVPVIPIGHYLSQPTLERDGHYFVDCQFCQTNHPGWHPPSATTPLHMMPRSMPGMEDNMSMSGMSSISSMALSHPVQQPLYDPADHPWPTPKLIRGRDPARDFYMRGLKRSGSVSGRDMPGAFPRFHEIPDSDPEGNEEDDNERESRPSGLSSINGSIRRQGSRRNLRSTSRPRSNSGYV